MWISLLFLLLISCYSIKSWITEYRCPHYEIFRCLIMPIIMGIAVQINNIGKNNFPKPPLQSKAIEIVSNWMKANISKQTFFN